MNLWIYESMNLWIYDSMTLWLYDSMTLWLYDSMTLWLFDSMTLWLYDSMTLWLYDSMTLWLYESFYLSIYLIYLSISLSIYLSISISLSLSLSLSLSISISISISLYPSLSISTYLYLSRPISISIYLYQSISQYSTALQGFCLKVYPFQFLDSRCFARRNLLTMCFPLRLRSDKEWKRLDRGTLNFVFWFCYHYSLCCSDQFSTREGRRTQQNGWSCNSWSRGNAGWHCRVVAERFPKKFKSNWAHYFSVLCKPLYTLAIHSCNMVSWLYTHSTGTNGERFCFYPSGCMTNLRILPCWFISYLNFCWSASLSLLVLPQFEVLEHLLLVLRYLDNF